MVEEKGWTKLDCKPPKILSETHPVIFKGANISLPNHTYILTQPINIFKLYVISTDPVDKSAYISERARAVYIAVISRPDLSFGFAICSQYTEPDTNAAKRLNNAIKIVEESVDTVVKYVKLNKSQRLFPYLLT